MAFAWNVSKPSCVASFECINEQTYLKENENRLIKQL